jgi:6-phosphofructokinase 2
LTSLKAAGRCASSLCLMPSIATLTMNPAIDVSLAVDRIQSGVKLRCRGGTRDPGGGGINVARVV